MVAPVLYPLTTSPATKKLPSLAELSFKNSLSAFLLLKYETLPATVRKAVALLVVPLYGARIVKIDAVSFTATISLKKLSLLSTIKT